MGADAMTIMLELSAEEAAALQAVAEAAGGVSIEAVLHGLVAQLLRPVEAGQTAEEPDAAEERRREQGEVEANIKRWHAEAQAAEEAYSRSTAAVSGSA